MSKLLKVRYKAINALLDLKKEKERRGGGYKH